MPLAFLAGLPWGKLLMAAFFAAMGAIIAHKADTIYYTARISHVETQLANEKAGRADDVRKALEWATLKQRSYDDAAIQSARQDAARQQDLAADASSRVRALQSIPPRTLVRGCITYEFVRQLDAAIKSAGPASSLPLPTGKPSDACAPVTSTDVVRWLLGVVETALANGQQLNDLIAFFRTAQAAR